MSGSSSVEKRVGVLVAEMTRSEGEAAPSSIEALMSKNGDIILSPLHGHVRHSRRPLAAVALMCALWCGGALWSVGGGESGNPQIETAAAGPAPVGEPSLVPAPYFDELIEKAAKPFAFPASQPPGSHFASVSYGNGGTVFQVQQDNVMLYVCSAGACPLIQAVDLRSVTAGGVEFRVLATGTTKLESAEAPLLSASLREFWEGVEFTRERPGCLTDDYAEGVGGHPVEVSGGN